MSGGDIGVVGSRGGDIGVWGLGVVRLWGW